MSYLFGAKLRYLRQQQGIVQAEVARQLSVTRFHINNLELDRDVPSLELVLGVSALFQATTDYLLRDAVPIDDVDTSEIPVNPGHRSTPTLFGAKLRHLRKAQNMTQATLVHRLGMRSQSHISLLEASHNQPSLDLVLQLADLFDVTTDYLLRDDMAVKESDTPDKQKD